MPPSSTRRISSNTWESTHLILTRRKQLGASRKMPICRSKLIPLAAKTKFYKKNVFFATPIGVPHFTLFRHPKCLICLPTAITIYTCLRNCRGPRPLVLLLLLLLPPQIKKLVRRQLNLQKQRRITIIRNKTARMRKQTLLYRQVSTIISNLQKLS